MLWRGTLRPKGFNFKLSSQEKLQISQRRKIRPSNYNVIDIYKQGQKQAVSGESK